jgi:hypothetical protein
MARNGHTARVVPGVRGVQVVTRSLSEVGIARPVHHDHVQVKPGDLEDAHRGSLPDRPRRQVTLGVEWPRMGDELVDLLPQVVLLPSRPDPGSPEQPPEIPGYDEGSHQAESAERAQDPACPGRP